MHRTYLTSKFVYMAIITMLITSATGLSGKRNHARRFLFGNGDQSNSFSQLALLKQFLSSSSDGQSSKIDKLFQILDAFAADDKNESSSSSNKLNRLVGFLNNSGSSSSNNNLNLAMKLINLAQGTGSFSSLSMSDMKSLVKFVG